MATRIEEELALLRRHYPDVRYVAEGQWVLVPAYPVPAGWTPSPLDVAFQIPVGHPGTQPYGFYVLAGVRYNGATPANYSEGATPQPPFPGAWGRFSWAPETPWQPKADIIAGSNLFNWVRGFADRFREGS